MKVPGFVGSSYTGQSPNTDAEQTINLILEQVETGNGKNQFVFYRRPGYKELPVPFQAGVVITSGCPLVQPIENQFFTFTFTASNGTAPYTWALVGGAFPTGLTLDGATGIYSGYASVKGTFPYTLRATDAHGHTADIHCATTITQGIIPVNLAALIQHKILEASKSRTFDTSVVVGHTIIVAFGYDTASPSPTVSDNLGNVYTKLGDFVGGAGFTDVTLWAAPVTHGGACTVTVVASGPTIFQICISEFSGVDTGIVTDGSNQTAGVGAAGRTTSVTTAIPTDLLIAVVDSAEFGAVYTADSPLVLIDNTFGSGAMGIGYLLTTSSGAKTAVFSGGRSDTSNLTCMVALKAQSA